MALKRITHLIGVALILCATAAPAFADCAPQECVGGKNSDGTTTVCTNMGGGVWRCKNVVLQN